MQGLSVWTTFVESVETLHAHTSAWQSTHLKLHLLVPKKALLPGSYVLSDMEPSQQHSVQCISFYIQYN